MKKILIGLGLTLIVLTGCSGENVVENDSNGLGDNVVIIKDKSTGCHYIKYERGNQGSIAPYYDENGKVKGCKNNEKVNGKTKTTN